MLSSPLAAAMLLALALNVVLRLGVPKAAGTRWRPADGFDALKDFAQTQGRAWGARVELVAEAENFLEEFSVLAPDLVPADREVELQLRYDEVGIQVELAWRGAPRRVARPGPVNVDAEDGSLQVALMRHWADEMRSSGTEDGRDCWSPMSTIGDGRARAVPELAGPADWTSDPTLEGACSIRLS